MVKKARFLPTYCEPLTPKRKLSERNESGTVRSGSVLWSWEHFECLSE